MKFFKTNDVDDVGIDRPPIEVASEFWTSDIGRGVASGDLVGRLDRFAIEFMSTTYGGWDPNDRDGLDEVLDAVFKARPWETR